MCCHPNPKELEKTKKAFKGKRTKVFYKVMDNLGQSTSQRTQYGPGSHSVKIPNGYDTCDPRGIHVYRTKRMVFTKRCYVIPVVCALKDLVVADIAQAVFTKIHIRKQDWLKKFKPVQRWEARNPR